MDVRGFKIEEKNGIKFLTIPSFTERGFFKHCFTTRVGGVSPGVFASLNLSMTREENAANKEENYRRVCGALGVHYESLTLVNYAHGNGVHTASADDAGKGVTRTSDFAACDALLIDGPSVTAVTLHADCTPVFLADKTGKVAGVGHAGWKGVLSGLAVNMVNEAVGRGCVREDILVGIGPHIMDCCFEVQDDVAQPFRTKFGGAALAERDGKTFISLQNALLIQLSDAGIPEDNISLANMCTHCNGDLFYSHRRDKGKTGAMGSFIAIDRP